jgi:hypothetical protein
VKCLADWINESTETRTFGTSTINIDHHIYERIMRELLNHYEMMIVDLFYWLIVEVFTLHILELLRKALFGFLSRRTAERH